MKILCAMYSDSQIIQIQRRLPKARSISKEFPAKSAQVMLRFAHLATTFGRSIVRRVQDSKNGYAYRMWTMRLKGVDVQNMAAANRRKIHAQCHNLNTLLDHFAILPSRTTNTGGIYGRSVPAQTRQ